jgi:hypothetical protein
MALVAACDSGSSSSFDDPMSGAGKAGEIALGGSQSDAGGGGKSSSGSSSGGSATQGGAGTQAGSAGTEGGGVGGGNGGSAGSSGSGGSGGTVVVEMGGASEGGSGEPLGGGGAMGGDGNGSSTTGEAGQGGSGEPVGCGGKALAWQAQKSNVMLLMDRSGTMFDLNSQPWAGVRDAVLPVIDANDGSENIGFMAMSGESAMCPLLDEVAPAAANYAAIASKYNALTKPAKGESPFMMALDRAQQLLAAAPEGPRFVILVIDGHPDYCNDGDDLCPVDSVVSHLQKLHTAGITTLVAGLPIFQGADTAVYAAALQSYANAGIGAAVASVGDTVANVYFRCNSGSATPPSWKAEFVASGKPAQQALGSYSASPGTAPYTTLTPAAGAQSLTSAFTGLFAQAQSCRFEATNGKVKVASAAQGVVTMNDSTVPYDADNGWQLASDHTVELVGSACTSLRATPGATVKITFPCDSVTN